MRRKLKEIASIHMGNSLRSRLEYLESGPISIIQMKDLTKENTVDCSGLRKIGSDKIKASHLVKPGDLIFRSRGLTKTTAILKDDPGDCIVVAPLLRIRVSERTVLPEYLNWYLSQTPAQNYLISRSKGTALKMISKKALENIEIDLPPFERQKTIVELADLTEEEQRLMNRISGKRKQLVSAVLLRQAKGE